MIVQSQVSENPTDLYNVLSFISLFSAMLPASFYLEACGKTQIKTVVTNSDMEITLHFISHFISYSLTVDALWAIKKSFKEIISECLLSTRYRWLWRRSADVGIDRQLPCPLQKEKKSCAPFQATAFYSYSHWHNMESQYPRNLSES